VIWEEWWSRCVFGVWGGWRLEIVFGIWDLRFGNLGVWKGEEGSDELNWDFDRAFDVIFYTNSLLRVASLHMMWMRM